MNNWDYYTNTTEDTFIRDLDLSQDSKDRLEKILQKVAEKAYEQGVEDAEVEE